MAAALIAGALVGTGGHAYAAPRRVAVLNLATEAETGQKVAQQLRGLLQKDQHFESLPTGPIRDALAAPLPGQLDRDGAAVAEVEQILDKVRAARTQFGVDSDQSLQLLQRAERILEGVFPTDEVVAALADVNFQAGLVFMDRQESATAGDAFRVVRRLAPERTEIDPKLFAPNYVEAYRAAGLPQTDTAPVVVRAPYDGATVYVDGKAVGETPYKAKLAPGKHYIWAEFEGYVPAGARLYAIAYSEISVDVPLRPLSIEDRVARVRRPLAADPDSSDDAIREAASEVSSLTGAPVVVVIRERRRGLGVAVYDASVDRLSRWRFADDDRLAATVAALPGRPPPSRPIPLVPEPGKRPADPVPWYETTVGISAISTTAVVTVLSIVFIATSGSGDSPPPSVTCCSGSFE